MITSIKIRKAELTDALNLLVLKKQVFISTYAINGIRKDFSEYINAEFSVNNTENAINDKNKIILIAESNGFMVGCAEINLLSNCPETKDNGPELNIMYVFEHFKGKGVGYSLISKIENLVKEKGFPGLWLTVYHLNENAISFYKRQNYKIIGSTFFEMGGNKYENKIMNKRIK
ncbi:MAG: GNAT family N-acetyltransferase [Bacteroidales bacterium]|nr:GNAT family N-acetyltransferase [Bacteroidales bacterium]